MMTPLHMERIVNAITYKPGWEIYFREDVTSAAKRPYIQIGVTELAEASRSPLTGKRSPWRGAKHYLSQHMCRQEIVGAVYGLIQAAEMHEMREWFRYKGASIYNPHLDPAKLAEFARKKENFDVRENAMTMETDL